MKTIFVSDLAPGMVLNGVPFAVAEKKLSTDKNTNQFYDIVLADKTGQVRAKVWPDNMAGVDTKQLQVGKVIAVDAHVVEHKGQVQLNILKTGSVDETKVEEYIEASRFSVDEMFAELEQVVREIENFQIKQMLQAILADAEISRKLKYWPAGLSFHHDFRSGLLQHILECLTLVSGIGRFYPDVDMDIVSAGIILHDLGKIEELDANGVVPRYSLKGSVLGHVYIGTEYVDKYLPADTPENIRWHLKHIILSHNGTREKGASVSPITAEALLVSAIDDVSADLNKGDKAMRMPTSDLGLTDYNRWLERWMWAGRKEDVPAA